METKQVLGRVTAGQEAVRDYLSGYAGGDAERLRGLAGVDWPVVASAELARRRGRLVEVFDDGLLLQVASGLVSVAEVARAMAREVSPASPLGGDAPPEVVVVMREAVARIAWSKLGVASLERQGCVALDRCELAVWDLREALGEAFIAGGHASA